MLLVSALAERDDLADVEVIHIMTIGQAPYVLAAQGSRFRHNAFFIGSNVRDAVAAGNADYTPVFLSEIPALFQSRRLPLDIALISTTPPDAHGFCSLGVSVDVVRSAVGASEIVIAEVNPNMPRTHGAGFLHVEDIDLFVPANSPILELPVLQPDDVSSRIGRFSADLVPHGATLQLGIGAIPNALLAALGKKADLGLHSEMISDGVIDLIESGVINCKKKTLHAGKAVTSFCMGSRRLYDFVHDNPFFEFLPTEYVNDPFVIARNDRMISINSALQMDLTGQVCADSIGTVSTPASAGRWISSAARRCPKWAARSWPFLPPLRAGPCPASSPNFDAGAGVVTTRGDVHWVVTEYGVAELKGRTVRERTLALISIAHPDFRAELLAAAKKRHFVTFDQIPWPEGGKPYPAEFESDEPLKDSRSDSARSSPRTSACSGSSFTPIPPTRFTNAIMRHSSLWRPSRSRSYAPSTTIARWPWWGSPAKARSKPSRRSDATTWIDRPDLPKWPSPFTTSSNAGASAPGCWSA